MCVMVVEDNLDLVVLYQSALKLIGIEDIRAFADGRSAQAFIEEAAPGGPDAVILDMHLPYVDGEELLSIIQRAWDRTWVFVITADADIYESCRRKSNVETARIEAIFKPVRVPYLQKRIQECVAQARQEEGQGA